MVIKIRDLKVKDINKLNEIICKYIDKTKDDSIKKLMSSKEQVQQEETQDEDSNNVKTISVFVSILLTLFKELQDEIRVFFADLINVSYDEYLDLPIDTDMCIIEQLAENENIINFFSIASRVFNKIKLLEKVQTIVSKALSIT